MKAAGYRFPVKRCWCWRALSPELTHRLSIYFVVLAAAAGAIIGDNIGFWIGHAGGYRLIKRYGRVVHFDEDNLKIGLYLFQRYGGAIVFVARWIPLLRMWGAVLAGSLQLDWKRFLIYNAAGGIVWAAFYGGLAYAFGDALQRVEGATAYGALGLAAAIVIAFFIYERRTHDRWLRRAQEAFPGPLK